MSCPVFPNSNLEQSYAIVQLDGLRVVQTALKKVNKPQRKALKRRQGIDMTLEHKNVARGKQRTMVLKVLLDQICPFAHFTAESFEFPKMAKSFGVAHHPQLQHGSLRVASAEHLLCGKYQLQRMDRQQTAWP